MADPNQTADGTLETRADVGSGSEADVRFWVDALKLAEKEEEGWRKVAEAAYQRYAMSEKFKTTFNILYSNVETIVPAVYNSTPVPDIRPRDLRVTQAPQPAPQPAQPAMGHNGGPPMMPQGPQEDPTVTASRDVARIIERTLTVFIDQYDFDHTVRMAVKDSQIGGRGVVRVRYEPSVKDEAVVYQAVRAELVPWSEFRRGPARRWEDTPWIAFRHYMTREQLRALSEKHGDRVPLEHSLRQDSKDGSRGPEPEVFKRAEVWEIWDKAKRETIFIAPSFKEAPVSVVSDALRLRDFFPIPRPLQDVDKPDTLVPTCPFEQYREQARELDDISRRIAKLVKALRWKGVSDSAMRAIVGRLRDADDGDIIESDAALAMAGGSMDKAFWFMPTEKLAGVLTELVAQREAIKQTIYEIIGISDILRGQVDPREKAAQSNLKAQWGASRLTTRQAEVARFARDLIRIKSEIIANLFEPDILQVIAAMPVTPEHTQLMRSDALMSFRVDIETDSTIQADIQRTQQNVGQFVQGFGAFVQAVGPAVESGFMPPQVAADLLKSFARAFKLGRQAEDALEQLGQQAQQQQDKPDPEMAKAEAEIQRKNQELQIKQQVEQQKLQIAEMKAQMDAVIAERKMHLEAQKAAQQAASDQAKLNAELEARQQEMAMQQQASEQEMAMRAAETQAGMAMKAQESQVTLAMRQEEAQRNAEIRDRESQASIAMKRQQAKQRPKAGK